MISAIASQRIPVVHLEKPAEGEPCNQCGLCCIEQVCDLGLLLGNDTHCKALEALEDGRYRCGLAHDPYRYLPTEKTTPWQAIDSMKPGMRAGETALKHSYQHLLGVGQGCDSSDA